MKSRKSSLGLFKQELAYLYHYCTSVNKRISWNSFSYSNCTRELKAVPDGSTPLFHIPHLGKKTLMQQLALDIL
jgi:hypothetical protein